MCTAITRLRLGLQLTICWRFCVLTIMPEHRTKTANILVATDSVRVVRGGRGDYLEFSRDQIIMDNLTPVIGTALSKRWIRMPQLRSQIVAGVISPSS